MKYKEWLQNHIVSLESTIIRFEQRLLRLQSSYRTMLDKADKASITKLMERYNSAIEQQETAIADIKLLRQKAVRQLEEIEKRDI